MDFSETIEACDLKVGRCRQLIELRKVKKVKVIPEKNPVRLISMKPRPRCLQYQWSSGSKPMVLCPSSVVRPHFSNIFSLETAWPIKAKFYVEPPWEGGRKVYINGPGHMTKMATLPI